MHISIASVTERDIDLLLLEAFVAAPGFAAWFVDELGLERSGNSPVVAARRSVTRASGESDLEIDVRQSPGCVHRLLIENKVGAGFQPQQAERYRRRGDEYLRSAECTSFSTVLIAPAAYLGQGERHFGFDRAVTYEAIAAWYDDAGVPSPRRRFKQRLLRAAIEKATLGYQPVEDEPVTAFWRAYWQLALERAPELAMREPGPKPAAAGFVEFRPAVLPAGLMIVHKLPHGHVDLQIAGYGHRLAEIHAAAEDHLDPDMRVAQAAKSAAVRISVPHLDTTRPFATQVDEATRGLRAAKRLLRWHQTRPLPL